MRKRTFYGFAIAVAAVGLTYAATEIDFSALPVNALWMLAGFGAFVLAGIYLLIVKTEDTGGKNPQE
jgi:hypothetical protein